MITINYMDTETTGQIQQRVAREIAALEEKGEERNERDNLMHEYLARVAGAMDTVADFLNGEHQASKDRTDILGYPLSERGESS